MARDFTIPGESLVSVKGNVTTTISSLTQLGLADSEIRVTPVFKHRDITVNAWGEAPPEIQWMLGWATIRMTLIHVDTAVLQAVVAESMCAPSGGGPTAFGQMGRAGSRMGGGGARFAPGYRFVGLNISAPISGLPWRF